jgi:hypothetical protein
MAHGLALKLALNRRGVVARVRRDEDIDSEAAGQPIKDGVPRILFSPNSLVSPEF